MQIKSLIVVVLLSLVTSALCAETNEWKKISFEDVEKKEITALYIQMPVFSQVIRVSIPKTWEYRKPAFEKVTPNSHYIAEYLPKGQSVYDWEDMLTIQGFKGLALKDKMSPEILVFNLASSIKSISEKDFIFSVISNKKVSGYHAVMVMIGCANLPSDHVSGLKKGEGEIGLYLIIKGKEDMYIVHKSWKTESFDKDKLPIKDTEIRKWVNVLNEIKILEKGETLTL